MRVIIPILVAYILITFPTNDIESQSEIHYDEIIGNQELVYTLTYIDTFYKYDDPDRHYYIKGYEIMSPDSYHYDLEYQGHQEYYYFLVSSFDEYSHLEANLYKTESLVRPEIVNIKNGVDNEHFWVIIEYVPKEIGKTADEIPEMKIKSKQYLNFERAQLNQKTIDTLQLRKWKKD